MTIRTAASLRRLSVRPSASIGGRQRSGATTSVTTASPTLRDPSNIPSISPSATSGQYSGKSWMKTHDRDLPGSQDLLPLNQ